MKSVTASEILEELIALGMNIRGFVHVAKELGLTHFEYVFYTAVADNESAVDVIGKSTI